MKREEVLKLLMRTQLYLAILRNQEPENEELRNTKIVLDNLEQEFYKGYPLEDTDKAKLVAYYAGKILVDGPYGELTELMAKLAVEMGHV